MQNFIRRPILDLYPCVRVTKETEIEFENKNVKQSIKDMMFHSVTTLKSDNFEGVYNVTIRLEEGDVLMFEEEGRGYIKPVEPLVSIEEAIEDLESIKDLG